MSSRWTSRVGRIAGFSSRSLAAACPASSGYARADAVSAGATGFLITLSTPLSSHVGRGAPVRFVRHSRYSLYHAGDGDWYLGYRRCNAIGPSVCGAIQPLSGPYKAYSGNPGLTGLLFEYFDVLGARLSAGSSSLARVDISARSASHQLLIAEDHTWVPSDSATVTVAVRNRRP